MAQEITQPVHVLEGTWEQIAEQADRLAGKRLRVEVFENGAPGPDGAGLPFYATATPAERARAWREWCDRPRRPVPPLSDEAISRETIYGERD